MNFRRSDSQAPLLRRMMCTLICVVVAALISPIQPARAESEPNLVPLVHRVDILDDDGEPLDLSYVTLLGEGEGRRIVGFDGSDAYLIDPETYAVEGPTTMGFDVSGVTHDPAKHQVYLGSSVWNDTIEEQNTDNNKYWVPAVGFWDPATGVQRQFVFPDRAPGVSSRVFANHVAIAVDYSPIDDRLYVITQRTQPSEPKHLQVTLHGIDAAALRSADAAERADALLWSYPIDSCASVPGRSSVPPYVARHRDGFVTFFCSGIEAAVGSVIVKVGLGADPVNAGVEDLELNLFPIAANLSKGFATGDATGDRIYVVSTPAGAQKAFIFDVVREAWTGAIPLGTANIYGAVSDTTIDRLYVIDQKEGILITDASGLPVALGKPRPLRMEDGDPAEVIFGHPAVDPETRRIFVTQSQLAPPEDDASLLVFEDRVPVPTKEQPYDPDQDSAVATKGFAAAVGARTLQVGGVRAAFAAGPFSASGLPGGDRGAYFATTDAELSTEEKAGASAARIAFDEETDGQIGASDQALDPLGPNPVLAETRCEDFGGNATEEDVEGSQVRCDRDAATSEAAVATSPSFASDSPVLIGHASSKVQITRTADDLLVTEAEAVARNVDLFGSIHFGEVRSVARTVAGGEPGTASSIHEVTIRHAAITDPDGNVVFECGQCDPNAVAEATNRYYPNRFEASAGTERRDSRLKSVGSPGGAQALVIEDDYSYWSDRNVNHDKLRQVSGFQLVVFHDGSDTSREVIQLASVLGESRHAIERPLKPGVLELHLVDPDGSPLSGGAFEVRSDVDGNGVFDGSDALIPGGRCRTATDGTGTCLFEEVAPGPYVVRQTDPPPGFALPADFSEFSVDVVSNRQTKVTVTNVASTAGVEIILTDEAEGGPLSGATFALYSDDGDGVLDAADERRSACDTGDDGFCGFADVPLGAYVLHQESAPVGYQPADDIPFELTLPGQVAGVAVVNGLASNAAVSGSGSSGQAQVEYFDGDDLEPVIASKDLGGGSGPGRVIRRLAQVPAQIADFLRRDPVETLLFLLVWSLVGLPAYLAARRRQLNVTKEFT